MRRAVISIGMLMLVLGGCSKGSDAAKSESADDFAARAGMGSSEAGTASAPSVAEINAQPVIASDGSSRLTPLAANAPTALGKVAGGCSFVYQGRSLLVVGGERDTADKGKGVLVIDGRQVILPGADAGGLQVLESGPTLTGDGYTVAVVRGEGAPTSADGKNEWGADLVVRGPAGETTFSQGKWSCTA